MSETPAPKHHIYDDIQENDNPLPNWWLYILFGTIVFGAGYWYAYQVAGLLPNPGQAYAVEAEAMRAEQQKRAEALRKTLSEEGLLALAQDAKALDEGTKVFGTVCIACHGPNGEGAVGPNLTDGYWLHGPKAMDIYAAVQKGFPEKGMPPWGPSLGEDRVKAVVAHVLSLRGKNLPGKAPQGDKAE